MQKKTYRPSLIKCGSCTFMGSRYEMATGFCESCYMLKKSGERADKIESQGEARQYAIDWQVWSSEQSLSYGELIKWQELFSKLAEKFDLVEELKENGII